MAMASSVQRGLFPYFHSGASGQKEAASEAAAGRWWPGQARLCGSGYETGFPLARSLAPDWRSPKISQEKREIRSSLRYLLSTKRSYRGSGSRNHIINKPSSQREEKGRSRGQVPILLMVNTSWLMRHSRGNTHAGPGWKEAWLICGNMSAQCGRRNDQFLPSK